MKKLNIILLFGAGLLCSLPAGAQEFKEHGSKEFTLTKEASGCTVYIYNISGFIKVEGYSGSKVIFETDKTISAENARDLEQGKKEFSLGFEQKSYSIVAFIASPFDSRPKTRNYNIDIDYEFNVDYTVKVPAGINLHISTVNNGVIEVNNVSGTLHVNNVNEAIEIKNAAAPTYAHTVNGDVTVTYLKNPLEESSYQTINGDIKITYQQGLSADMQFKSMNGDFFTDFPTAELLPAIVDKKQEKKGNSIVYKLNSTSAIRFGKGGRTFRFETLNGNVYIRKQS